MEIPNKHLAQIFGMNIEQEVITKEEGKCILFGVKMPEHMPKEQDDRFPLFLYHDHFGHLECMISDTSILKRPLSSITDEHAIEFTNVEGKPIGKDGSFLFNSIDDVKRYIIMYSEPNFYWKSYQYLHALGYTLPITLLDENNKPVTYSVETLVQNGVYKLI